MNYRVRLEHSSGAFRVIDVVAENETQARALALKQAGEGWFCYEAFAR